MAGQKLTNGSAKQAPPKDNNYKLSDGGGLYLLLKSNGSKHWHYANRILGRLKSDAFPHIGNIPINEISPQDVIAIARRIEARDALDVAARVLQNIRRVCHNGVRATYTHHARYVDDRAKIMQ